MLVLGIDPGYARVGYGLLDFDKNKYKVIEYGSITTEAGLPLSKRLYKIHQELEGIVKKYKIDSASIEELFFNTNTKTAINVAQARGVILSTLEENAINVFEYTPLQVKQALVGYGRADKLQMKSMVKTFLCLDKMPKLDDTTDALALSICHCHSYKYNSMK